MRLVGAQFDFIMYIPKKKYFYVGIAHFIKKPRGDEFCTYLLLCSHVWRNCRSIVNFLKTH